MKLDLFEDRAWVSIVAFTMHAVHPRGLWPMPGLSSFAELNVRTYVVRDGKPGVYFLSIEAAHPLAAWLARMLSPLPYKSKKMRRSHEAFEVGHPSQDRYLQFQFRTGKAIEEKTQHDLWLTERYCLYADKKEQMFRADVHHEPWVLHEIELQSFDCSYQFSEQVQFKRRPDLCHYSPGVPILAWWHERL